MNMPKSVLHATLFLILIGPFSDIEARATQFALSIEDIAQTADIIFAGTVVGKPCHFNHKRNMIFTDVMFEDITILYKSADSAFMRTDTIALTFMGGQLGSIEYRVSDFPRLDIGSRYLIFALYDGNSYINPIVGGDKGLYRIIEDKHINVAYIVNSQNKVVTGLDSAGLHTSRKKILEIKNQLASSRTSTDLEPHYLPPPVPLEGTSSVKRSDITQEDQSLVPLTVAAFENYITTYALKREVNNPKTKRTGKGSFTDKEGKVHELPNRAMNQLEVPFALSDKITKIPGARLAGAPLEYCGVQDLKIVMEQVPSDWWCYIYDSNAMYYWNRFMDIFRYGTSGSTYASDNGQNEFCGWLTEEEIWEEYETHWNGAAGLTVLVVEGWPHSGCTKIKEADILFNASQEWTENIDDMLNYGHIYYPQAVIHELGHVWGYMAKVGETYDYDYPSVMHRVSTVLEDGAGIHTADAQLVRLAYKDQTDVINITDIGVESYYADGGLKNSYTDDASYHANEYITINNVTVENMSNHDVSNVILSFYLSTDREITSNDYYLGSFKWENFPIDALGSHSFQIQLPLRGIPTGNYFVGAMVKSDTADDFEFNNSTYIIQCGTTWPQSMGPYRTIDYYAHIGPEAEAGPDQVIEAKSLDGTSFTLIGGLVHIFSGNVSYTWKDERHDIVGRSWSVTLSRSLRDNPYIFTLTVVDDFGFSSSDTVSIRIQDTTAPALTPPPNIVVEATGPLTAVSLGEPTVSDLCDPSPLVECNAPSLFPIGDTKVAWWATDAWHNVSRAVQLVTVRDTTPPDLTAPPDITIQEIDPLGTAVILGEATVSDLCDARASIKNDAPSLFGLGITTVTWEASDRFGNVSSAEQKVTVVPGSAENQSGNIRKLIQYSATVGRIDVQLRTSLLSKISAAEAALARGNIKAAVNNLKALINQVEAQNGKKIDMAVAAELILRANRVIEAIG
jgi:hypothetical protein